MKARRYATSAPTAQGHGPPGAALPARHRRAADRLPAAERGEGGRAAAAATAGDPARRARGCDRGGRRRPDLRLRPGRRRQLDRRSRRSKLARRRRLGKTSSHGRHRGGRAPTRVAAGEGAYWVSNADADTFPASTRRPSCPDDPRRQQSKRRLDRGGSVWVANSLDGTVSRIDPSVNRVVQVVDVGNGPVGLVYAAGSIWWRTPATTRSRVSTPTPASPRSPCRSLRRARIRRRFTVGEREHRGPDRPHRPVHGGGPTADPGRNGPSGIAFGDGAAWLRTAWTEPCHGSIP